MSAIDENLVAEVAALVEQQGFIPRLYDNLRETFPEVRFTLCSEDDINAGKPVVQRDSFDIYLVGSGESCLCLTNDYDLASAVVIAEIEPD